VASHQGASLNRALAIRVVCILVGAASPTAAQGAHWPTIQPVDVTRTYDVSGRRAADTPLRLIVRDVSGSPAYRLECHNGDYDVDSEINYSGDFQCALFALRGRSPTSWNLLATSDSVQQDSDWMNRGRMLAWQLHAECGDVPDYGRTRRFRLRHMLLTIQFKNIRWSAGRRPLDPGLDGFTVSVQASPDPHARTASSAPAPLRSDPEACDFPLGG
jgi:hypothetical protein